MKSRTGLLLKLTVFSLLLLTVTTLYSNGTARAGAPRPTAVELIGIGAVTLTPGQGLRVNLVNAVESATVRLTVKFIGNDGQVFKSEEHSLAPGSTGGAAVFTPDAGSILVSNAMMPVHVIVESVPDTPEAPPFPYVMPSLEIFDRKAGKVISTHAAFLRLNSTAVTGGQ